MDVYRGFGLALFASSLLLLAFTLLVLGLHPLLALWVGLAVTGLSMFLTPRGPFEEFRELSSVIEASVENIARVCEFTGARGGAVYVARGDAVYVYAYPDGLSVEDVLGLDSSRLVHFVKGAPVVVLRSPVAVPSSPGDPCVAVGEVAVRRLGVAESILCTSRPGELVVEFRGLRAGSPAGVRAAPGSVYGLIAASIAAKLTGAPARLIREEVRGSNLVVYVEAVRVG
mgnify:CR=1 FL=1